MQEAKAQKELEKQQELDRIRRQKDLQARNMAGRGMQHTTMCNIQRAMCNSVQCATYNSVQHTACNVQHTTTCSMEHIACNVQH